MATDAVTEMGTDAESGTHADAGAEPNADTQHGVRIDDVPDCGLIVLRGRQFDAAFMRGAACEAKRFDAALALEGEKDVPGLLQLGPRHLLLCAYGKWSAVVRLRQENVGGRFDLGLEWARDGDPQTADPQARAALLETGVVGEVRGFGLLTETDSTTPTLPVQPLRHDVSHCGWEMRDPPARVGYDEPVLSLAFKSPVVGFLDPGTMRWLRAVERLPQGYGANVEPLSNGDALVLMCESHPVSRGMAGRIRPLGDALL